LVSRNADAVLQAAALRRCLLATQSAPRFTPRRATRCAGGDNVLLLLLLLLLLVLVLVLVLLVVVLLMLWILMCVCPLPPA
jgi:hypothetical protein